MILLGVTTKLGQKMRFQQTRYTGSRRNLLLFLLAPLCFGSAVFAQPRELTEAASYARSMNNIVNQFRLIVNRSGEFGDLAIGVVDGDISKNYAERQGRRLSAELWVTHTRISNDLEEFSTPPSSVSNKSLRGRLTNLRSMAEAGREAARSAVASGEELLLSAIDGNADVFQEVSIRNIELLTAHLRQQIALLDVQHAYEDKQHPQYFLTGAIKAQTQALLAMMNTALEAAKLGINPDFTDSQADIDIWIELGFNYVRNGRNILRIKVMELQSFQSSSVSERQLKKLLVDLFKNNMPQSFDVEERMLVAMVDFATGAAEADDQEFDALVLRLGVLEDERARLVLERQGLIADR